MAPRSPARDTRLPSARAVRVLLIDDEADTLLPALAQDMEPMGFKFEKVSNPERALGSIAIRPPDAILLDLHFPGDDRRGDGGTTGGKLLAEIRRQHEEVPVVVFTSCLDDLDTPWGPFEESPHCKHAKPDFRDRGWAQALDQAIRDAIDTARLARDPGSDLGFHVGKTKEMRVLTGKLRTAARNALTVLIQGESGVGKQLAAEAIHRLSGKPGRFEHCTCWGADPMTLESTLFGHESGASAGAIRAKPGLFELADKGTLFLDKIEHLPMALQNKVMTVVENGTARRMGAAVDKKVDVRLVAATNHNLSDLLAENALRDDLAYRLAELTIFVPPLRQRMEDLPEFFKVFVAKGNERAGKNVLAVLRPETEAKLKAHAWGGNIRELDATIARAVANSTSNVLLPEDIEFAPIGRGPPSQPATESLMIAPTAGSVSGAATPLASPGAGAAVVSAVDLLANELAALPPTQRYEFAKGQGDQLRKPILIEFIRRLRRNRGVRISHKILADELDPKGNLDKIRQFLSSCGVQLSQLDFNQ